MGYLEDRRDFINAGRPLKDKKKYYIPKVSAKRAAKEAEQKKSGTKEPGKLELDLWFHNIEEKHFSSGWGTCMETGDKIPRMYARHATAHLLPKKLFKSVATHELNYLILSAQNGSHDKTHRVDKFVTMKIWPEAAKRIRILIPLLPMDELRHISNQLLEALDNT